MTNFFRRNASVYELGHAYKVPSQNDSSCEVRKRTDSPFHETFNLRATPILSCNAGNEVILVRGYMPTPTLRI